MKRLLRLLGLIVLSVSLLLHHGPAVAVGGHVHGSHDESEATGGLCDEQGHAHRNTADSCNPHGALHGYSCWGACCLTGPDGAILVCDAQVEASGWRIDEGPRGSCSHALDPPPPRATA